MISALASVSMPVRDPGDRRVWTRRNGGVSLTIEAGYMEATEGGDPIPLGLPWGSYARVLLIHMITLARIKNSRTVEMGRSLRAYLLRIGMTETRGEEYTKVRDQIARLVTARIVVTYTHPKAGRRMRLGNIASDVPVIDPKTMEYDWQKEIVLSHEFFETIKATAMPIEEHAVAALRNSPRALDVYIWLVNRLHQIDGETRVSWEALRSQFTTAASDEEPETLWEFRKNFRPLIGRVSPHYPGKGLIREYEGGLILPEADPPVPPTRILKKIKA